MSTESVLAEVASERAAQDALFGQQDLPDLAGSAWEQCDYRETFRSDADGWKKVNDSATYELDYTGVFLEEVYEALAESDPALIRAELIQAIAVGVKWIEAIDRRPQQPG